MGRKQSAMMKRQQREINVVSNASFVMAKETFSQYFTDTACIALNNLGWGKDRINAFCEEWSRIYDEFHEALEDTVETDYVRAKFDERIKPISNEEKFRPFEERYCYSLKMKY